MLRSMYSGISGMKVNQTKLDVIGNNISNVGTTSFKSSRARFSDMLSQNVSDAMAPSNNQGGVNASQVGLGVQLASIDSVMTQGMMQPTGRQLDVAIDGDGFFMVSKGPAIYGSTLEVNHRAGAHNITEQSLSNSGSEIMYSRDGSFILDEQGNLLTGDGFRIMGYSLTNDDSAQLATGLSPNAVNTAGLDFRFGPGSQLNGFKVVLGSIGPGTVTTADVNKGEKTIVVNGDFSSTGALTTAQVESAINKGLSSAGISQRIYVSGKPISFEGLGSESVLGGTDAIAPQLVSIGGFNIQFDEGSELNGYSFAINGKIEPDANNPQLEVSINTVDKVIEITGNFLDKSFNSSDLQNALNNALQGANFTQEAKVSGSAATLANSKGKLSNSATSNIAGLSVAISKGTLAKDIDFKITNIADSNGLSVEYDDATGLLTIKGDFTKKVNASDLENAINAKLPVDTSGVKLEVKVSGTSKPYTGLTSDNIQGGETDKAPSKVTVGGVELTFDAGSALNGYKFVVGTITEGTRTSAKIDEKAKTITINGDFVTPNAITAKNIQDTLTRVLQEKGINQGITVSGKPMEIGGVVSEETFGGTSVESINQDGSINFVDATQNLKSYDGQLKTLKIPDKVRIPGTDTELRIKTYTIDKNGVINGVLEDGRVAALGQIAMASFKNPEGLTKLGGNLYSSSVNSGEAVIKSGIGTLNDDNSKGYGDNLQGMLEMSNVDLAEQFTDMITSSRAFQAAGKMITTGDEILQDIINLKR